MVRPPYVITPLEGLQAALGKGVEVHFDEGRRIASAEAVARQAEVAIVVAGYGPGDEGEKVPVKGGGDRDSLTLHARDEELIRHVAAANANTVVVLIGGSAIITESWRQRVPAIVMAWYPGMEGGHAIADILLGKANPSGRLPCVFPRAAEHLPFFDSRAQSIEYDLFHGYRLMEREGLAAAFPFGFGLGYSTFAYRNLRLDCAVQPADGSVKASVDVTNTGPLAGAEVVQLYVGCEGSRVERPRKELKGFARVELAPAETRSVTIPLPVQRLAYYETAQAKWVVEPARYRVSVGASSRDSDLLHTGFEVQG
jgi:beta-glucosidase